MMRRRKALIDAEIATIAEENEWEGIVVYGCVREVDELDVFMQQDFDSSDEDDTGDTINLDESDDILSSDDLDSLTRQRRNVYANLSNCSFLLFVVL